MWNLKALQDWINKNLDLNDVSGKPGPRLCGLRIRACIVFAAKRVAPLPSLPRRTTAIVSAYEERGAALTKSAYEERSANHGPRTRPRR
jgi:hypothetical protein